MDLKARGLQRTQSLCRTQCICALKAACALDSSRHRVTLCRMGSWYSLSAFLWKCNWMMSFSCKGSPETGCFLNFWTYGTMFVSRTLCHQLCRPVYNTPGALTLQSSEATTHGNERAFCNADLYADHETGSQQDDKAELGMLASVTAVGRRLMPFAAGTTAGLDILVILYTVAQRDWNVTSRAEEPSH